MGVLLIILQIIGAMPGVIKFLQMLWDYIQQIRDRQERAEAKRKFRAIVFRRKNMRKMTVQENDDLLVEAKVLYHHVQSILAEEKK
jgi:glycerol uptake facilitator-like aquaporin